jgi:hypothetical protein
LACNGRHIRPREPVEPKRPCRIELPSPDHRRDPERITHSKCG